MASVFAASNALKAGAGWSGGSILVIALVVCCLVMMFTMRMGRRNRNGRETHSKKNEKERSETENT